MHVSTLDSVLVFFSGLGRPNFFVSLLKFELWTLNNFNDTDFLRIHFSLTGLAEQVWQTQQSPDQCFDWDDVADPSCRQETCISPTQICTRMNFAVRVWKRTAEIWEQADCERGGHTFLTGVALNKIHSNKVLTGFRALLFRPVSRVYLKSPMSLDTNLHTYGREANFVTMPRLKRRLPSDVYRPKKASETISEHQIF